MTPTVGRIVHYRLTADNCRTIEHDRTGTARGNTPRAGDVVPLIVVRVWSDEYAHAGKILVGNDPSDESAWHTPASPVGVNGQAILDGNDSLWVTSAPEGDANGFWSWPPRA